MLENRQPLSDTGRGTMTHGQMMGSHTHTRGQLLYPSAGALATTTERGTWLAPANRVTWTPPGFEHAHRAYGETEIRRIDLPVRFCRFLPAVPSVFAVSPLLREALLALSNGRSRASGPRHRLRGLVIDELVDAPPQELYLPEPVDDRLRAVTSLLHADPSSSATLRELGHATGASERVLSRLFQGELGVSFRQWRSMLRVQHALVLLGEDLPVTTISSRLGWANPTSFIEAFVAVVGETPGRYQAGLGR
ncbi:helix-turn-helix domain-containing protein [Amycolatopsis sp. EV170708-02-1]|uniref:AraC family transcriptional regulator n=1 Tax=Amycolatopsis sp. EV170708-02-1 TaxID=2919322 RepID=UPI001F0C138F|nr:helix-turn-helix transcriptional regulator [Amycolatopsis sp. EV170708-02-1]UMP04853.1 helix-turn-helix transcriptional regulator [Amycolatopsis sp. EV170708-02-1]